MKKILLTILVTAFWSLALHAQTTLVLASPQNGAVYNFGDSVLVGWQYAGVTSVKVKYSTNGGSSYSDVGTFKANNNSPIPGYGVCYWHVPNLSSTICKIKLEDASNASLSSILSGYFSISAPTSVTITSPNGGEKWTGGTTQTITWTQSNLSAYVNLYYSIDTGLTWNYIGYASSTAQPYSWLVPTSINSTKCRIKVADYYTASTFDVSNANFTIAPPVPSLKVTSPNGGETWAANTVHPITWTQSNIPSNYLNIYYSVNGGVNWTLVTYVSASNLSYSWTTPCGINSSQCKIRLRDYYDSTIVDVSDANFSITSSGTTLAVTSPNGGETWSSNSYQTITWSQSNICSQYLNLYYSTDGGVSWNSITNVFASTLSYSWYVPNGINSKACRIKIADYSNPNLYDISNANFTISSPIPTITVTSPNGGENWNSQTSYNITWTATNTTSNYVDLYYSTDGGIKYTYIGAVYAPSGTYSWYTPNVTSSKCRVKVTNYQDTSHSDISNANFSLTAPVTKITVTSPNGGETWNAGTGYNITWTSSNISAYVSLYYTTDTGTTWNYINYASTASLSYNWTIPSGVSSKLCRVKVADYYTATTFDVSNANFTIAAGAPTLNLTTPNGGESWAAGSTQYIYWSSTNISNVKLEYSTDGGSTYTTIITNTNAASSYYTWVVPMVSSKTCRVRISDVSNAQVSDVSNANFTITTPTITVTSPNGGETWASGSTKQITWTSSGISAYVNLYYSTDGGVNYTLINWASTSTGTYSWLVPSLGSTQCKIKVADYYTPTIFDVSNANFTIKAGAPSLTVTSPNGGENWNIGSTQYIQWSAQNIANVKLEYSIDGGSTYTTIVSSTNASSSYYTVVIPNTPSKTCKVRVSDASNAQVNDISNANFTITAPTPSITAISNPYAGQQLTAGTSTYIYGSCANVANVKIEFSSNGGSTWTTVLASTPVYSAYYFYNTWTVPNTISNNCKIRVSDVLNPSVNVISGTFSIINCSPTLSVSQPYNGQQYTGGSYTYIYWSATCVANISIEFSSNGGSTWSTVAASTSGTTGYYYWAVPNTPTSQGKIRIKDLASGSTLSALSGTFNIGTPSITVTSPNGGENWTGGTTYTISWTSTYNSSNYVNMEYSTNNGSSWTSIGYAYYTSNSGSYSWNVPNVASTQCLVRVSDYYNSSINDKSNNVFTIKQATPQITVTSPNGGETWAVGYSNYIYWTSMSVSNVKIEYTTNNGSTWNTISSSYPASYGYYYWSVPNTPSSTCKVRISDASNVSVTDLSNNTFTISNPTLTITSPNGGESWQGLTAHNITWSSTNLGSSSYVNLEYSTDNGASWNYIVYGTSNYGYYNWNVPNAVSTSCLVRVTDYYNSTVKDVSNAVFSITSAATTLSLYSPNGGQSFGTGSQQTISWYSQNIANVKLEYSTDGGSTYTTIISSTSNYGYYYWTVPNTASVQCKVRVSDASNASTSSTSATNFSIVSPTVKVTSPNGLENWVGLTTQNITWNSNAISNYVTLQYSTNNLTWNTIGTAYSGTTSGTYSWTVPNITTTKAKVRVLDYYNNAISDISDTTFTITNAPGALQLTSPNGFENYAVGSKYYVQWTNTSVTSVNLEYSINNGSTWTNIASGVNAATGYYYWTVPNTPSTACLVRVSDANNVSLSDMSNNNFTIISPYISVTYPNGSETFNVGNSYYIQWASSGVSSANIEFSKDGGSTYTTIVSGVSNYNYYWWTPTANQASTQCKIRVKDAATGSSVVDASDANFTVQNPAASIVLNSPYGGETWTVGSSNYITWNSVSVASVKIQYSTNGGTSWTTIVSNYAGANSYYSWTVPNTVSSTVLVKVANASDSTLNDVSGLFSIVPVTPTLAISYPNGGQNLLVGAYTYIAWTSSNVSCVNLEISYNGGTNWTTLASNISTNYYYWNVPNYPSTQCLVRVTDCYSALSDSSNSNFTISTPVVNTNAISITSINKNVYCKGDSILVKLSATGVYNSGNYYSLQLSNASGTFSSATFIGGKFSTNLTDSVWGIIPNYVANGSNYSVRIVSSDLVATSSNSSAFKVQGPTADFAASSYQTTYLLPQEASIQFVPNTTGSVKTYDWNFGDGGTSSSKTPTHYYGNTIYFDVQLTVTDSNGCNAIAYKPNYIHTEYFFNNSNVMPQGFTGTVTGASFVNANVGCFTLSNGNCYVTTNGGYNWVSSITGLPFGTQLTSVSVINGYWVIAGTNGTLCYSTNQGATWTVYYTGTYASFNGVYMTSATNGYAVGSGGSIYIFNGTNWVQSVIAGISNVNFYGVSKYGTNGAIAVGSGGSIYYYNGTTWSAITSSVFNSSYNFTSVYTVADTTSSNTVAYVTSSNGSICRMVYANNAWTVTVVLSGTGTTFKSISGNGNVITAVGNNGVVYQSVDGGVTFVRFSLGISSNLNAVFYYNSRGYIGGDLGTGRAFGLDADTSTIGIENNSSIEKRVSIYPNPATSYLTIQIDGGNNEVLQVTIKDVAGRNVMDAFNEKISGTFKKQVDVSALAQGTYFVFVTRGVQQVVRKINIE